MLCKNCGKKLNDNATMCPVCGKATGATVKSQPVLPQQAHKISSTSNSNPTPKRYCTKCGNAISPDAQFCNCCGASITHSPKTAPAFSKLSNGGAAALISTNQKRNIIIAAIAVLLVVVIAILIISSKIINQSQSPNYMDILPNEICDYYLNNNKYTSKIDKLTVIREDTKDGLNTAKIKLNLSDDNLSRNMVLSMTSRNYNTGGWNIENYAVEEQQIIEWKEESQDNIASDFLYEKGFKSIDKKSISIDSDNNRIITFDVNASYNCLDIKGTLDVIPEIQNYDLGCPLSYIATTKISNDDLLFTWKIDGLYEHLGDYDLSMNLETSSDKILWDGMAEYETTNGGNDAYLDNGSFNVPTFNINETNINNIAFVYSLYVGYPYYELKFTKDNVYI